VADEAAVMLNSGHEMPAIELGTWPLRAAEAEQAVESGIAVGCRTGQPRAIVTAASNPNTSAFVSAVPVM
jgi:diketogulonate reductase-like aldo/keto reductase